MFLRSKNIKTIDTIYEIFLKSNRYNKQKFLTTIRKNIKNYELTETNIYSFFTLKIIKR